MKKLFLILLCLFTVAAQAEEVRFKNPIFYGPLTNKNKTGTYEYYLTPTSKINKAYDDPMEKCELLEDTGSRILLKCLSEYNIFYYTLFINAGSTSTKEERTLYWGEDELPTCLIWNLYGKDLDKVKKGASSKHAVYATDTLNNECGIYEDFNPWSKKLQ